MKYLNPNNESRIITIFASISVVFVLLVNGISLFTTDKIHASVESIYNHPLKVSNAAIFVQKGVVKMHRDMKDVVLSSTDVERAKFAKRVDEEEKNVYKSLKNIKKNILGEDGLLLEKKVEKLFKDWKPIRDEVIDLMYAKEYDKAVFITKNKGAVHVQKLEQSAEVLYEYAHVKADSFQEKAHNTFINFNTVIMTLSLLSMGCFLLIMFYIRARINNYLNVIRKNERELRELNKQYSLAIEGTSDGLWDWNLEEGTIYFSPRWKEMLGYRDDELVNTVETWESRIHPNDLQKAEKEIEIAHSNPNYQYHSIHRLKHKNGSWIWVLDRGQTLFDKEGKPVRMVGFHADITKEKLQEAELHEQEEVMIAQSRHAAMGEMISMIAHQWRQPLSVIAMDANNIQAGIELDLLDNNELREVSQDIIKQTQELSKTIDDFREFFKPNKLVEEVSVKSIVADSISIVGKSLQNNNITLNVDVDDTVKIRTFSRELMQVLINILKNAKEAFCENKTVKKEVKIVLFSHEDHIKLRICDNAGGISTEIIDSVFDPYFTTKNESNGTGLGLYMSKTIVEKHLNGVIIVVNKNNGVCFEIDLPYDLKNNE